MAFVSFILDFSKPVLFTHSSFLIPEKKTLPLSAIRKKLHKVSNADDAIFVNPLTLNLVVKYFYSTLLQ